MVRIGKAVCKANDMVDVLLLLLCVDMKKCVGLAHFFFVFFLFLGFQRYGLSCLGFLYFFEI